MRYLLLADAVMLVHVLFVLFVIFGSLLVLRRPWIVWLHAPALAWGAIVEIGGMVCPLTPLESRLRVLGGESGYAQDFLSHWLLTLLYPAFVSRGVQITMGALLILLNLALYSWVWTRRRADFI
ncbi:MAG TPA: DUF2784 domain-containing protein [Nitrospira sp.]|jgi:hypothetical protein|nr:DUF2784 domain-containing protein [Nitrospira sp.]